MFLYFSNRLVQCQFLGQLVASGPGQVLGLRELAFQLGQLVRGERGPGPADPAGQCLPVPHLKVINDHRIGGSMARTGLR